MRCFTAAFALGCVLLQLESRLPEISLLLPGAGLLLAAAWPRAHRFRWAWLLAAGACIGYGYAAFRAEVRLSESLPEALAGQDLELTGVVASLPQLDDRGARFIFRTEPAPGVPEWISLAWYADREGRLPQVRAGQRWRLTARLRRPRGLANPHGFDFEAWALERGIRATGYVRSAGTMPLADDLQGWPQSLHRLRQRVRDSIDATLAGERLRGVVVALAIGDQDAIGAEDWTTFWATGVGHLMSISGLHITMLAALACAVTAWAWVRIPRWRERIPARKVAVLVGVTVALAYTLATGYAVPAQRTFAMLAVMAACVLLDRHGAASRVLALAALVVLVLDPWAVLSSGFWLSFGAVAAIFLAMGARTGRAGRLHSAVVEQLSVTLAMTPMMLALFQQVSLVAPLANAFAIPVVSLVVVPLSIAGGFMGIPFLAWAAHEVLLLLMIPLEWLAALDWAAWETAAPPAWAVASALAGAAWMLAPRGVPMRSCGLVWIAPLFVLPPPHPAVGEAWLDVLDVGQGLSIVVRTATHAWVFDAGPSWQQADSGERIVVPYLRGEGVREVDGLLVSHRDDDHAGGAASIILARSPAWMLSSLPEDHPLRHAVEPSLSCLAGQRWTWDGVEFLVLNPGPDAYDPAKRVKENDRGCVVRVQARGGAALLTADVEAKAEAQMVRRDRGAMAADVIVVPHHGSRTSSTAALLAAVAPRIAVISLGFHNRFGHPHPAVIARYGSAGIAVRRTDLEGALRIVLPGSSDARAEVKALVAPVAYWSDRWREP